MASVTHHSQLFLRSAANTWLNAMPVAFLEILLLGLSRTSSTRFSAFFRTRGEEALSLPIRPLHLS